MMTFDDIVTTLRTTSGCKMTTSLTTSARLAGFLITVALVGFAVIGEAQAGSDPRLSLAPGPGAAGAWQSIGSPGAAVTITPDPAGGGGEAAVRLDFVLPPPLGWAGVVVLAAPAAWGAEASPAFDLSAARQLTFRARGRDGGERIRVKVAVAGDQPFGDSAPLPFDSGWLTLSTAWQHFALPVDGRRLGRVVTPFVAIANRQHNPGGQPTLWLDAIVFTPAHP